MNDTTSNYRQKLVWMLVAALFVLHHDFWWWNDSSLVFGFMPLGLFYHAIFSVAAALTWALANRFAWPEEIETWAAETGENPGDEGGHS